MMVLWSSARRRSLTRNGFGCVIYVHGLRRIRVTYYDEKDKSETTVLVPLGENLLEAAHQNNVDLEGEATF